MESVTQLFYGSLDDVDFSKENKVLRVFREVNRLATIYVNKARSQGPLKAKRGRDEEVEVEVDQKVEVCTTIQSQAYLRSVLESVADQPIDNNFLSLTHRLT